MWSGILFIWIAIHRNHVGTSNITNWIKFTSHHEFTAAKMQLYHVKITWILFYFLRPPSINFCVPNVQASTPTGNIFGPITGRLIIFGPYKRGKERKRLQVLSDSILQYKHILVHSCMNTDRQFRKQETILQIYLIADL